MSALCAVYEDFSACCDEFVKGVSHFNDQAMPKAADQFQKAYESVGHAHVYHNKYASYFGLARVLSGDTSGLDICRHASKNELYDGDVYFNLAKAEWFYVNRKLTIIALKKGLQVDNRHPGLRKMRLKMCIRQRSPLPFLPRTHPLNNALGRLMRRVDFSVVE